MPQRMKVNVEIAGVSRHAGNEPARITLTDDPIAAEVRADYLFGRPVAERPAALIADRPDSVSSGGVRGLEFRRHRQRRRVLGHGKALGRRTELPVIDLDANGREV